MVPAGSNDGKQYADRDVEDQGGYYTRHVSAMTGERLHEKSDIAAELAHRDIEIDALRAALRLAQDAMRAPLDDWKGNVERRALDAASAALKNPPSRYAPNEDVS